MKKYLSLIIIFGLLAFTAGAQRLKPVALTTTAFGNALDTVDNTETHVTTTWGPGAWDGGITAQVVVTKISGTVGGTLGLHGSMNGTNWTLIGSATTPSDASANYSFNTTVGWAYYRISYAGTGTMSASMRCFILPY